MAVRCPCGTEVEGEDERETTQNVREHLIRAHGVPPERLMDVATIQNGLGDDALNELMRLDASMRAHLAPPSRSQEEIWSDNEQSCMVGCVSELPLTREQTGQYNASMICSFCAKRLVADDERALSEIWSGHLAEHARSGAFPFERVVSK